MAPEAGPSSATPEVARRLEMGHSAVRAGDLDAAVEHFYDAMNLAPDDHAALYHLGAALFAVGRFNISVFPLTRLVAGGGDATARQLFVRALREAPAPVMAAGAIARALADPALDRAVLRRRGWALLSTLTVAGVPDLDDSGHDLLVALLQEPHDAPQQFQCLVAELRASLQRIE